MLKLQEINSSTLAELRFKYLCFQAMDASNIERMILDVDALLRSDFYDIITFNHNLLETYLEFKDYFKNETKPLPSFEKIRYNYSSYFDMLVFSDICTELPSLLGLEIYRGSTNLGFFHDTFFEDHPSVATKFNLKSSSTLFNPYEYIEYNKIAFCNSEIDELFSCQNPQKVNQCLKALVQNKFGLVNFFANCSGYWCEYASISISLVDNLVNTEHFRDCTFGNHKFAILIEFLDDASWDDQPEYIRCIRSILTFNSLLKANIS